MTPESRASAVLMATACSLSIAVKLLAILWFGSGPLLFYGALK